MAGSFVERLEALGATDVQISSLQRPDQDSPRPTVSLTHHGVKFSAFFDSETDAVSIVSEWIDNDTRRRG